MIPPDLDVPSEALADLCRRFHVRGLYLFGSAARGELRDGSDVDLLVEFEPDARVGFLALSRLQRELAALLKRPVDLVPKGGLKPLIRDEVLAEAEPLFAA